MKDLADFQGGPNPTRRRRPSVSERLSRSPLRAGAPLMSFGVALVDLGRLYFELARAPDIRHRRGLALETIEGVAEASLGSGFIGRVPSSPRDATGRRCHDCRRYEAKPMSPRDARDARQAVRRAGLDDAVAYAFAKTTVLITASSRLRWCGCDVEAWQRAIEEYRGEGPAAWRRLGVAP